MSDCKIIVQADGRVLSEGHKVIIIGDGTARCQNCILTYSKEFVSKHRQEEAEGNEPDVGTTKEEPKEPALQE